MTIDYPALWQKVIHECAPRHGPSLHGPDHWLRVERNGRLLATQTGAKVAVVRLFAMFHDCQRLNESWDDGHGARGAAYAEKLRGHAFQMADDEFELLREACIWHTDGHQHEDPTIGTCWDADRLDLGRVGAVPDAYYMSTEFGVLIATHGSIQPWAHLIPAD